MEKTMKIQKLLPIQDRQYTDQQGQPRVFTSMGFVLTDGVGTIYAHGFVERVKQGRYKKVMKEIIV